MARWRGVIDYAKRIMDQPPLETAVDQKMEDQAEFVRWRKENVRPAWQGRNVRDQRQYLVDKAKEKQSLIGDSFRSRRRNICPVLPNRRLPNGVGA